MAKHHTHLSLQQLLSARLKEWRHISMRSAVEGGPELQELDQAQNEIDREALLNGQVSVLWKETQHQYYIYLGKWNTGERWVRMLIQNI
jgi:hypothetical protein